jgi:hypothetical protein
MMKRLRPDNNDCCKTKNFDSESLSKSFTETIGTLDTSPLDIISCIISSLGFVEKNVLRFVCKKLHSIIHRVSVSNNEDFDLSKLCPDAALNGYLEVLKWAVDIGCLCDEYTCSRAALGGHLNILKWAIGNGQHACALREALPWNKTICLIAAMGGHLDILKWAREKNCSWDENTCSSAAKEGHLEILEWVRENGCPWD